MRVLVLETTYFDLMGVEPEIPAAGRLASMLAAIAVSAAAASGGDGGCCAAPTGDGGGGFIAEGRRSCPNFPHRPQC